MKFKSLRTRPQLLLATIALLLLPLSAKAFELLEFLIDINISEPLVTFDYANLGAANTGVKIDNPNQEPLKVRSSLLPDFGLLSGEELQQGFVLYDGTLVLEAKRSDGAPLAEALRTTYRMRFDARMLEPRYLRSLFVRQGRLDSGRAQVRARAARLADARLMRFREDSGRWVRAVRALSDSGRADIRFRARMEPDGILGHYGYYTKDDGSSYVWAVLDKNSRYAIGLNVDNDDDGIFNSDDNCPWEANPDQMDFDLDTLGDACDEDDDADGVLDVVDNCPLTVNPLQEDYDFDGIGDSCDQDSDNDSVEDGIDECPRTTAASLVDGFGCSIEDRCPCDGDWKNHGAYVRCVAQTSKTLVQAAILLSGDTGEIVSEAASSQCGK